MGTLTRVDENGVGFRNSKHKGDFALRCHGRVTNACQRAAGLSSAGSLAGCLLGVCARRDLTVSLGSRFGFALNGRRSVVEHLLADPLRIEAGGDLTEVFKVVAARREREFSDDVCPVAIEVSQVDSSPRSADHTKLPLTDFPAEVDCCVDPGGGQHRTARDAPPRPAAGYRR